MERALIIHLANKLAALETARADAPSTSPTWKGLDAVERATNEVIAAAHAIVAAPGALPKPAILPEPHPLEAENTGDLLVVGDKVINLFRVTYIEETAVGTYVHFGKDDEIILNGRGEADLRAFLDAHAQSITWSSFNPEVAAEA